MLVRCRTTVKTKAHEVTGIPAPGSDDRTLQLRQRLMDALEALLLERPYADIAVTDIVGRAGTSKRAFYEVYPHKAACLLDQGERFHAAAVEEMEREVLAAPDRLAGVRRAVELVLQQAHERPFLAQAHLLDTYLSGQEGRDLRHRIKSRYATTIKRLADLDDGTERVDLDDEVAFQITGTIDAVAVRVSSEGMADERLAGVIDASVAVVRATFVGLWVEDRWGPVDLHQLTVGRDPEVS
jgi:AcrR family transcriptional regulator